jgi:hypothetical protein
MKYGGRLRYGSAFGSASVLCLESRRTEILDKFYASVLERELHVLCRVPRVCLAWFLVDPLPVLSAVSFVLASTDWSWIDQASDT